MYQLPKLNYAFNALEPFIDARTMELHYTKHHQTYVNKLNEALGKYPELRGKGLRSLLTDLESVPEDIRTAVRNHGGGHFNHSLFWAVMSPFDSAQDKPNEPSGELKQAINKNFGGFDAFQEEFSKAAISHFGSGWTWLSLGANDNLKVQSLANQDSPLSQKLSPILGVDLWEHAYYLKYQNRKTEYIEAWWNVVDWEKVTQHFKAYYE